MRACIRIAITSLMLFFAMVVLVPASKTTIAQTPSMIKIYGAVSSPLNLTYAELLSFPMVSEVANLRCVGNLPGSPRFTSNWTGVPLFYLLTLAQIKPEAYKIVTRGSDGFESDLLMEDALKPTTILALESNGGDLPQLAFGPAGPSRLVVPGRFGYKWVSGVEEIEVVTTDYKGDYESSGYSDEANVSNTEQLPTQTPPIQTLNVSNGNETFQVDVFTNASITTYSYDPSNKTLEVNATVTQGTSSFTDIIVPQVLLNTPYNITLDGNAANAIEADTNTSAYLYLTLDQGFHAVRISNAPLENISEPISYYPAMLIALLLIFALVMRKKRTESRPTMEASSHDVLR